MESGGFGCGRGEDDQGLSWRQEPDDSLSDHTIVVHRTAEGSVACDTYHVHKVVLAVGCRKSRYFERLLKSNAHFQEARSHTSHIALHPLAADMFPALLDYMYFQAFPLSLNTYSATPLHFLSDYFDVRNLRRDIEVFCQFDLSPTNCHIYYTHAAMLNNVTVQAAIVQLCVQESEKVSRNHDMFRVAPVEFWIKVLEIKASREGGSSGSSSSSNSNSSLLVESLLRIKADSDDREDITPDQFAALTDPARLPQIESATCALAILTWDKHLASGFEAKANGPLDNGVRPLSKLQRRCVEALGRVLVAEVPAALQPQWHSFIFASIRDCGGHLHHALVSSVVEMGIDRMARSLKALSVPVGTYAGDGESTGSHIRTGFSADAA
jgi:BTB/POZ domain